MELKIGCAYIRVSDERQDEFSPTSQLKKIKEFASKEGYVIPDEYVFYDDGISGRDVKKREEFNKMISIAQDNSHPFEAIFVWKFSRFARNQEQAILYKSLLRRCGVSVLSVSEPIPDGALGGLLERVLEWMDEFYSSRLSEEVKRGMEEKVSRGEPICQPPFGYYMKDKKWIPKDGDAETVLGVFQRFADGEGMRKIAVDLGNKGVRTKYGKMPDHRLISYMLNNPAYIGMIRQSPNGERTISKRDYLNDGIKTTKGNHEAIIPMELWDRVQQRLNQIKRDYPKYAKREQPIQYMLKGLVRCSDCGATLAMSATISKKNKNRYLQCCNYNRGTCKVSHSITMPKIEKAIVEGLEGMIESQQFVIAPKEPKRTDAKDIDYGKLIAIEERKMERAKQAFLAEIDTIEQYAQNKKDITERIESLKAMRDEKESVAEIDTKAYTRKVSDIVAFIKRTDVSEEAKNEALRTIVSKIVYCKADESLAIYLHQF